MSHDDKRDIAAPPEAQSPAEAEAPGAVAHEVTGAASRRLAAELMRSTLGATPASARMSEAAKNAKLGAALDLTREQRAVDGVSGAMASLASGLFFGASELMRRAQAPGLPPQIALNAYKVAARLADAFVSMTEAVERRRNGGVQRMLQTVRIEKVLVTGDGAVIAPATPTKEGGGDRE